ncbi:alpha/beta fold hydrolase [Dyella sp.]|uniref:alpha/beta fold hydrolase n=1 Tax=Dyella sp. TaxID=1869338 RepID=UPI0039C8A71B
MPFFSKKVPSRLRSYRLVLIALMMALAGPSLPAYANQPIRNVVLVHGAFADGSSWSDVIALLQRDGYHATAVQNPLTSLADDVTATQRVLARQHGDVILVGHSWAGAVVTEAGNAANVKGIVYLSALVPDSGESVNTLLDRLRSPMTGMKPDEYGLIWLDDPAAFKHVMAGDVRDDRVKLLASVAPPIATATFDGKITHAAWRDKPTWYLVTNGDHALPTPVQRKMADQIGAHRITLASSHMSLISHPKDVVRLIEQAAATAGH